MFHLKKKKKDTFTQNVNTSDIGTPTYSYKIIFMNASSTLQRFRIRSIKIKHYWCRKHWTLMDLSKIMSLEKLT